MAAITLKTLRKLEPTVGASETNLPIANFSTDWESALHFRCDMVCSSVTVSSGITVKLQQRSKGGAYADLSSGNASVSITGNGSFSITLLLERAGDQADLPLKQSCRLVISTGAGDSVTFDEITVQQR